MDSYLPNNYSKLAFTDKSSNLKYLTSGNWGWKFWMIWSQGKVDLYSDHLLLYELDEKHTKMSNHIYNSYIILLKPT